MACFLLLALALPTTAFAEDPVDALPAKAYLLMDGTTGQVLYEYQSRAQLPMASTTKIMTAILALEKGNLSDVVTVGPKPYETGGSTIYLDLGEQQTLQNLLYALMLESANDAAVAIAEHLAGTEEAFAGWMNAKAKEIGATQTHFMNAHGLHNEQHYTTAYDLALIARYAMKNKAFRELILVEEKEIPGFKENPPRKLLSHNRLLGYYEGANGVKNGFTEEAGLTNVASARRGDTELIAVVLGAQDRLWTSSMALLDYGFGRYKTQFVARKGDLVGPAQLAGSTVPAVAASDLALTLPVGAPAPRTTVVFDPGLKAPLGAGARLGELQVMQDGKVGARVELVAAQPVAVSQASVAGAGQKSILWLGMGMVLALFFFTRRRRRKPAWGSSGKPFGRERLYEIRNRRLH